MVIIHLSKECKVNKDTDTWKKNVQRPYSGERGVSLETGTETTRHPCAKNQLEPMTYPLHKN